MRKNIKNDKVIRAMAIGISAMLMASSPLTALAAEGEGTTPEGNDDNNIVVTPEAGIADQAQDAADKAAAEAKQAEDKAHDVKGKVQEGTKDAETEVGKDLADAISKANANIEAVTAENGSSIKEAGTDIANADTQLEIAEAKDKSSDAELKKAEEAADKAGQIAEDAANAMKDAQDKIDGQIEDIKGASTIADANAAYEEVKKTAEQAQIDFQTKLANYNDTKAAYDDAKTALEAAEEAYQAAIASADTNAAAAAAELAKAKDNADALAKALEDAKGAVNQSAKAAMDIVEKEELTQNDNGLNWGNEDKLFQSIMLNYYLPEVIGKDAAISDIKVSNPIKSKDSSYNYFIVTYKDADGVTQTKYYNYLMDDNQTSKDNIVIFEKRFEEVDWKNAQETNPDQYVVKEVIDGKEVTSVISKDELQAGKKDGSIVEVTDASGKVTYVKKNDLTDSKTLVSGSEITGTSKEDVIVDKDTKESWSLDENGDLIKTVTADVTTINYTGKTFTSDQSYETAEERDAAAAAKKKELAPATSGKDATINSTENTDYTYTANGTYIPTFTKTVDVNKEYESGILWNEANSEQEAKDKAFDAAKDKINKELGDYILIGDIKSDLSVSMTEEKTKDTIFGTKVTDDSDYLVTGTVSATYAKVTKKTVDQSTLGAIWDDLKALFGKGETANKKLEDAARAAVEADGGIFVSANWDDWKLGKATIRYVAGVKANASTEEKSSAQDAENALKDAMLAEAKASGATGIYNVNTNTEEIAHTSYSYTIDYLEKTSESKENKTIATETYADAAVLAGQIIQNLNYIQGNIKLTQKDVDYRKFVDDAKALTEKYQKLLDEAKTAQTEVEEAQNAVKALQDEIKSLKESRTGNLGALTELEAKLTVAEQNKQDAQDILDDILEKLDEAGGELENVIERLTPAPAPADGDGETGGAGDTEDGGAGEETTVVTPAVLAAAPVAQATVVAQNQAAPVVQIADEATPLADAAPANTQETVQAGSDKEETKEAVNIEEEAVPLADVAVEGDHAKMSWWWLLIVLLLGTTGYEMYKKHNEKKLKAQADNAEDAE